MGATAKGAPGQNDSILVDLSTNYMEDKVKGYTKITAALAAFVLLFVAIGVSTTGTVSAQAATITVVPSSGTTLSSGDTKKNNTACSVISGVGATCASGDNTYLITVADAAGGADDVDELDFVTVTVKNADLATVTPSTSPDSNAKTITLVETGVDTGVFTRLVTTKHASTGLLFNGGVGKITTATNATTNTVLAWDNVAGNDGINNDDLALTVAQQTAIVAANVQVVTAGVTVTQAANKALTRAVSAVSTAGVVTSAAFAAATGVGDLLYSGVVVETKAFSGNTLTVTYKPTGTLGISKSITIDNVKSSLVVNSPAVDLITKTNKTINFSADVTDTGAGYPSKSSSIVSNNTAGTKGRIQLFVGSAAAGAVTLPSSAFTAITDGWNVSANFSSTDIANIAGKVPWWIEAEDLAGNVQTPLSGYKGNTTTAGGDATSVIDSSLIGMGTNMLNGHDVIIYYSGVKETKAISAFNSSTGDMTVAAFSANVPVNVEYELKGVGLVTVDSTAPSVASAAAVQTGHNWSSSKPAGTRIRTEAALADSTTSIRVTFTDASGLLASTVTPASFSVAGNTVTSTLLVDVVGENAAAPVQRIPNDVFLTLGTALTSSSRPNVSVIGGIITDKAGNAVVSGTYKATDKLGVGLTTSKSAEFSKKEVKITITADEQLLAAPASTDKILSSATVSTTLSAITGTTTMTQTGALTYVHKVTIANFAGVNAGAEFMLYYTADDTSSNTGKAGHLTDGANSSAIIIELDKMLNGGHNPKVSVSDKVATCTSGATAAGPCSAADGPSVESVDPMIVTVDFNRRCATLVCSGTAGSTADGESKEYARDSYKTVTVTSAKLKYTDAAGVATTTTIDLATEMSSPDNKRFTIPVLSPKVGKYELQIKAVDLAGNDNLNASTAALAQTLKWGWKVTAALPVKLALSPGWNLISLPFQPANPAINSVIASTHPADIVMTFDNANQVWLVSRRDAASGLFVGDVAVMTSNTAYFVRTNNFQELSILRPPTATAAAAPPPPPAISVVPGWNLVPVVSSAVPLPVGIAADTYFGTLQSGANKGWLKAMTFSPLTRTWTSVTPGFTSSYVVAAINPCTGVAIVAANVNTQSEPCQSGAHIDITTTVGFQTDDTVALKPPVLVGKGYWLYATAAGVVIP